MTADSAALEAVAGDSSPAPLEGEVQEKAHFLVLGAKSFPCVDFLPMGTYLKYADSDVSGLEMYHHLLLKMVKIENFDDLWDECDKHEPQVVIDAIQTLLGSYSAKTPTSPGSP